MSKRTEATPEQLTTLLYLIKLGATRSFCKITTGVLGDSMGLSQQAASVRLARLQGAGFVERAHHGRALAVRLTERGLDVAEAFLGEVGTNLERGRNTMAFRGTVFTGLGEGRYYVSLEGYREKFSRGLGFVPFPGTLNLRLTTEAMIEQRRRLDLLKGVAIPGFSDRSRTYGPVKCFRATVEKNLPGAVLAIERTHYDSSVLEVISPVNLRRSLGLDDGDECAVKVDLGEGWVRRR
jgi:riboflavin kinase